MFKICPSCGYKNKPNEILCINCMIDISSIQVVDSTTQKEKEIEEEIIDQSVDKNNIKLVNGNNVLLLSSGDIVGRLSKGASIFEKLDNPKVISRLHFQVLYKDNKWFIKDLGSTNNTFLNNQKLVPEKEYEIKSGDLINIAGVIDFVVE